MPARTNQPGALEPAEHRQEMKSRDYPPYFSEHYHEVPQLHIKVAQRGPSAFIQYVVEMENGPTALLPMSGRLLEQKSPKYTQAGSWLNQ